MTARRPAPQTQTRRLALRSALTALITMSALLGVVGCTGNVREANTGTPPVGEAAATVTAASLPGVPAGYEVHLYVAGAGSGNDENTYLLVDTRQRTGIIIDPGEPSDDLEEQVRAENIRVAGVLSTHGHYDHIGGNAHYRDLYDVEVYGDASDSALYLSQPGVSPDNAPTRPLPAKGGLTLGGVHVEVIRTPGHTAGGVCYLVDGMLFTGDTLFEDSIGRTDDFESEQALLRSIRERLLVLPEDTRVYPGHGNATTIGAEKTHNPFLR